MAFKTSQLPTGKKLHIIINFCKNTYMDFPP